MFQIQNLALVQVLLHLIVPGLVLINRKSNQSHVNFLTDFFIKNNVDDLPYYFEYVSYKKGVNMFEESHQLQVCKKLLVNGATVFIEPSKFLLPMIQEDLSKEFSKVNFVSLENLTNQSIPVYKIQI